MMFETRLTGARCTITSLAAASTLLLLGACGGGGASTSADSGRSTQPDPTTAQASGGGGSSDSGSKPTGKPLEKFRVANFYTATGGGPGPSLDIYAYNNAPGAMIPLQTDVAYGTISTYASPATYASVTGGRSVMIGAAVHGTQVKTSDDLTGLGGFASDPPEYQKQATIVLTADLNDQRVESGGSNRLVGLTNSSLVENPGPTPQGSDPVPTLPPKPTAGELIVDTALQSSDGTIYYLTVDGACAKPTNGDPGDTGPYSISNSSESHSVGANYEVSAGSHALTIGKSQTPGTPPASCDSLVKVGDGTVAADAGSQVLTILYTPDAGQTIKVASAPIDS